MYWPLARIVLSFVLIPLIFIGVWLGYDSARETTAASYEMRIHTPGCVKGHDVDPSLSPCTNAPMIAISKATHQEHSDVNVDGQRTAFDLSVRDASGRITQYRDVYENFWGHVQLGQSISAQYWQGRLQELVAGEETYPINTPTSQTASLEHKTIAWIVVAIAAFGSLCSILGRRYGSPGFPWPRLLR